MEPIARLSFLLDFYGSLLTERQRSIAAMHWSEDMSLAEIAAETGITRQAAHDTVRKAEIALEEFEEKLGLMTWHLRLKKASQQAQSLAANPDCDGNSHARLVETLQTISDLLEEPHGL